MWKNLFKSALESDGPANAVELGIIAALIGGAMIASLIVLGDAQLKRW